MQNRIAISLAVLGLVTSAFAGVMLWHKRMRRTSKHHFNTVEFAPRPVAALISVEVALKYKMFTHDREAAILRLADAIATMVHVRRLGQAQGVWVGSK